MEEAESILHMEAILFMQKTQKMQKPDTMSLQTIDEISEGIYDKELPAGIDLVLAKKLSEAEKRL